MKRFGVDKNGFIITEVSSKKISPVFRQAVTDVLDIAVKQFAPHLDGVYLYGSVATGKAVQGKSDLDILLVLKENPTKEVTGNVLKLEKLLSKKYASLFRGVGLAVTNVKEVKSQKEKYGYLCYIKHLCVCIYGNDITKNTPSFKPTKSVARGFNGDIATSLKSNKAKLQKTLTPAETKKLSQEISKKIIRTGFSLVMPRAKSWTTNLQASFDTFSHYYPEQAKEMAVALEWAKGGTSNKQPVIDLIDTLGRWLTKEFKKQVQL